MNRFRFKWAVAAATVVVVHGSANAQAAAHPGREKARACAACHGPLGIATLPMAPNLAGQPEGYLVDQLKAYRSGKRVNEMMTLMAKPLSDEDIVLIAGWYASLLVEAREKP